MSRPWATDWISSYMVRHSNGSGHYLDVWHDEGREPGDTTHEVRLNIPRLPGGAPGFYFPSLLDPKRAYVIRGGGARGYLAPAPSDTLRTLIAGHVKDPEQTPWYTLLDKLAEEYPELAPVIDEHTAARYATHDS